MLLPLGATLGFGNADFVYLHLIAADGTRRRLLYTGGSGIAPGRLVPYIVPMMPGSTYSLSTPLRNWHVESEFKRIQKMLPPGQVIQASISAAENLDRQYIHCYGLQMFWKGQAFSNVVRSARTRR